MDYFLGEFKDIPTNDLYYSFLSRKQHLYEIHHPVSSVAVLPRPPNRLAESPFVLPGDTEFFYQMQYLGRIRAGYSFSQSHHKTDTSENGDGLEMRYGFVSRFCRRQTKTIYETLVETVQRQTILFQHHNQSPSVAVSGLETRYSFVSRFCRRQTKTIYETLVETVQRRTIF